MNKKTIMILAALGATNSSEVFANDADTVLPSLQTDYSVIAESFRVNPDTVRVLKMFSDYGALKFTEDTSSSVFVDPNHLPNFVIESLHESSEVTYSEENNLFVLDEKFTGVLAKENIFAKLGNAESIIANAKILEKLKTKTSPVLREDLKIYAKSSFVAR